MNQADLLRRARGALLGVAIGDAMGAPVEGRSSEEIQAEYGRITGFLSDEAVGTDDTDFTLFNAHLLISHGTGITLAQVEAEWRRALLSGQWYYRPGGFSDVISTRNLTAGLHAPATGSFNHQMWSDGVAMAISSAGVAAAGDAALAARLAQTIGAVSNGRDGIYAAQAVAAAIAVGAMGATPGAMLDMASADTVAGAEQRVWRRPGCKSGVGQRKIDHRVVAVGRSRDRGRTPGLWRFSRLRRRLPPNSARRGEHGP
jgi:ADP-ribosylglycohydrolase